MKSAHAAHIDNHCSRQKRSMKLQKSGGNMVYVEINNAVHWLYQSIEINSKEMEDITHIFP